MNIKIKIAVISFISIITIVLFSLSYQKNLNPKDIYRVYLDGEVIGLINSKEELESYIDEDQEELKELYNVDTVYKPKGLEIKRYLTYQENISDAKDIYEMIKDIKPFTIKGNVFTISYEDSKQEIYVLDTDIFEASLNRTLEVFVDADEYLAYLNDSQVEITTVGKNIESVSIKEAITVREDLISTDELIFIDEGLLSKYLLFGTIEEQQKYTATENDNISDIAFKNNLSPEEFLIANPEFTSVNNLLYIGQEVNIGLIKPQVSIEVIEHVVEDKEQLFVTETVYDSNLLVGNSYVKVAGVNGLVRATSKVEIVNGKIESVLPVTNVVLEAPTNQIVVQGGKVVPNVGDNTYWAWPTKTPYTISSYYGPRWGDFHDGVDIAGTGYGSPIYAANNGTIYESGYKWPNGEYIVINHNNGFYTMYAHLAERYVIVGESVTRGEVIGTMGATGYVTGTHLHFGAFVGAPYRTGSYSFDPYTLYK